MFILRYIFHGCKRRIFKNEFLYIEFFFYKAAYTFYDRQFSVKSMFIFLYMLKETQHRKTKQKFQEKQKKRIYKIQQ